MCWNSTSSLTSFIIGYIICLILYIRNKPYDRFYSLFLIYVLSIQFFEYLMWKDQDCNNLNNISNQILTPVILLQPLVLSILSLFFIKFNNTTKNILIITSVISLIITIISYFTMKPYTKNLCSKPYNDGCNSLIWEGLETNKEINIANYFGLLSIIFICLLIINNKYLNIFVIYLVITFLVCLIIKPFKNSFGSHWCFFAIGLPLIKLFIN